MSKQPPDFTIDVGAIFSHPNEAYAPGFECITVMEKSGFFTLKVDGVFVATSDTEESIRQKADAIRKAIEVAVTETLNGSRMMPSSDVTIGDCADDFGLNVTLAEVLIKLKERDND